MTSNLRSIRTRLGLTQRDLARVFAMTASNVSHYEAGKQALPPKAARQLIEEGCRRGVRITFDDIYGERSGETLCEPQQEKAHPVRAVACTTQSVRLTADRREGPRRAESVAIAAPDQLPLVLDAGQSCLDAEPCSTQIVSSRPDHRA